jgi:hypothetical protein
VPTSRPRQFSPSASIPIQTTNTNTLSRARSSPKPTSTLSFSPTRSTSSYASSPLLLPPRQNSFLNPTNTISLPTRSTATSNYSNAYNHGASSTSYNRPFSSSSVYQNQHLTPGTNNHLNYSSIRQQPEQSRINSTLTKPSELTREFFIPPKMGTFRTVNYVPSSYNRYYLP